LQEEIILFTQWSKGGVLVKSLMLIFIFTLTSNVVFNPAPAWAVDDSQRDTASETAEASKDAKGKLSGAAGGVGGFFSGIMNWIKSVTDSVNNMWGMENGTGMAKVVNGIFYLVLIAGVGFGGKMLFNIFSSAVGGKVDERYERPSFRKK
jgi:uncharacterized BrkB/YihY/UPF0761 family membrane protein